MASGGFSLTISQACPLSHKYVLGLLNSRLLFWKLRHLSNVFRGGWITCTKQYFGELPIRMIDFSDPHEKATHDRLVRLVEQITEAKAKLAASHTDRDTNYYERKSADLDAQIESIVYELYGLTDEEISTVEGAT